MNPTICFKIELPYLQTGYEILRNLALSVNNLGNSKFEWIFNINDIETVVQTLGKTFEFNNNQIEKLKPYAPLLTQVVPDKSRVKGKGYFKIVAKFPKLYIIETIINAKKVTKRVPTENILIAWEIIKKQPLNKPIKTSTVSENICSALGLTRFNRAESGSFDFAKFFGERKDYYLYFYAPIKVLESEGVIEHHKDGFVERKSEHWEMQTEFKEEQV